MTYKMALKLYALFSITMIIFFGLGINVTNTKVEKSCNSSQHEFTINETTYRCAPLADVIKASKEVE